jgi:hypothetical protein
MLIVSGVCKTRLSYSVLKANQSQAHMDVAFRTKRCIVITSVKFAVSNCEFLVQALQNYDLNKNHS